MSEGGAVVRWAGGGEATIVALDARSIVLRSTVPAPPGARIDGTLGVGGTGTLRIKVHACRQQPAGDFRVEGRPLDLPRDRRLHLERLIVPERPDRAP